MEEMINGRMAVNAYDCPSHAKCRQQPAFSLYASLREKAFFILFDNV